MVASSGDLVVVVGCHALSGWCVGKGLVVILVSQTEAVGRQLVLVGLSIGLGGAVLLQLAWNTVHGQVLVHQVEVASLDLFEHLVTEITDKAVVVLALDVDNEFFVAGLSALGQSHHFLKTNVSLEDSIFNISDLMSGKKEVSGLFHAKSIVLEHLAGEDNVL